MKAKLAEQQTMRVLSTKDANASHLNAKMLAMHVFAVPYLRSKILIGMGAKEVGRCRRVCKKFNMWCSTEVSMRMPTAQVSRHVLSTGPNLSLKDIPSKSRRRKVRTTVSET